MIQNEKNILYFLVKIETSCEVNLRAVERYDFAEPGSTDGTGVSPLNKHLAAVGASAEMVAWREDAASWPVHTNDALAVQRRMMPI